MKKTTLLLTASLFAGATSLNAALFADDFSETSGTQLSGKTSDLGNGWVTDGSNPLTITASNTVDTSGAARRPVGLFDTALTAGQTLTLSFETLEPTTDAFMTTSNSTIGAIAVVDLIVSPTNYTGSADLSIGDTANSSEWAVTDNSGSDLAPTSGTTNNAVATSVTFTYEYDTGAWTLSNTGGFDTDGAAVSAMTISGTTTANLAFSGLRIWNRSGGDIALDNLTVTPEPSALLLSALSLLGLARRKR